jgi:hypothetical protein
MARYLRRPYRLPDNPRARTWIKDYSGQPPQHGRYEHLPHDARVRPLRWWERAWRRLRCD